jgi:PAS domain S-box-containing protein
VLSLAVVGIVGITRYQMQRTRDFYAQATALEQAVRERGEAEKMALDQEKQLRAIVENTPDLIARFDREFRHLYVNPALRGSTGEAYTDYIGKRGEELDIAPETVTRWNTMLSEVFESGEPKVYEFEIETSTGTQHLESVIAPEIVEGEIQTVISITRDITPRKLLEAERLYAAKLEADLEAQRELNALKNRFNSMVSHEFRNPLSIIQLSGNILERYRDRLDPDRMNEHIRKINGQVERMASMLEDMLFLGRDEAGRTRFQPDELDIGTFCEGLVKRFRQHDHGKHNLVFDAGDVTPTVSADTELLTHIFNNLLENALKYSPAGTTVTFRLRQEDDSLIAEIADEGIGIPEEDQARIFDAFHRGDNVREVGGTGLGLAVVQRSVDAHGGSVRFTSVEGEGTTFTVYLPIVI